MHRKITAALLAFVLMLAALPIQALDRLDSAVDAASRTIREAGAFRAPGAEWQLLGLVRGGYVFDASQSDSYYLAASAKPGLTASEALRRALVLKALGYPDALAGVEAILENPMTLASEHIWGLIALGGSDSSAAGVALQQLLGYQQPNGGFSLDKTGQHMGSDPDLTAMALQALAFYRSVSVASAAIESALGYLSSVQQPDGGFMSMGYATAESAAQAILAMTALGIDQSDPRFVKNGNTVYDALMAYALPGGSFRHLAGETLASPMATEQALLALVALRRQRDGRPALWDMSDVVPRPIPGGSSGLPGRHPDIMVPSFMDVEIAFSDLTDDEHEREIIALAQLGIIQGVGDGRFAPHDALNRAQFTALLVRALGLPSQGGEAFIDVPADSWFALPVGIAVHYGLIAGRGEGRFDPTGAVTVQEAAVMLHRAAILAGDDGATPSARDVLAQFDDYRQAATWAADGLAYCVRRGILAPGGMALEPARALTRGETAALLHRLLGAVRLIP